MKNIVFAAVAMALVAGSANALTLKKGEVISSDGSVAKASETANGQARLAADGVLVAGGVVYIDLNGTTIEVDVDDIRGKSKEQVAAVIGEAAVEQLMDLHDDAVAHAAEIVESGEVDAAIVAVGKTAQEIADEIANSDAVTGAVVGVTDATADAVNAILQAADHLETDPVTGEQYQADCDPGSCPQ